MSYRSFAAVLGCTCLLAFGSAYGQTVNYSVSILDTSGTAAAFYQPVTDHLLAAGQRWNTFLQPTVTTTLDIRLEFTTAVPLGSGRSQTSAFVGTQGGRNVFEQAAASKIRNGFDQNGALHDIEIQFNPTYLQNELWFDPNPTARTAPVPSDRTDAMSVMLHELGHAFGFNGWGDHVTGTPRPRLCPLGTGM